LKVTLIAALSLPAALLGCITIPVIPPPAPFSPAPPVAQLEESRGEVGLTTGFGFMTSPSARYTWLRDDLPWLAVTVGAHQGFLFPVPNNAYLGGGATLWLRPAGAPTDGVRFAFGPGAQLSLGDLLSVASDLPGVGADFNAQVAWRWRGRHLLSVETSFGYATHLRNYYQVTDRTVYQSVPLYSQDLQVRYDLLGEQVGGFVGVGAQLLNGDLSGYSLVPLPTVSAGVSW